MEYCSQNELLIYDQLLYVNQKGHLRKLKCPFKVKRIIPNAEEYGYEMAHLIGSCNCCGLFYFVDDRFDHSSLFDILL